MFFASLAGPRRTLRLKALILAQSGKALNRKVRQERPQRTPRLLKLGPCPLTGGLDAGRVFRYTVDVQLLTCTAYGENQWEFPASSCTILFTNDLASPNSIRVRSR